ncbi:glycosyltransferase family 39 protein [Kutzneria kofuensis]|uniref:Mannosyltransferase n=1 Tax=Kutzneria kofuensis TaxID=103725 RepID=A0A7W9ND86_9PSEU|nr:glycosyltransferase family 39 protein [Kutzneria kofuensis]MBB5888997.1 mannosyltransferase [Kutzneria kofuensis]
MGGHAWLVRALRTRVWLVPVVVVMLALGTHHITVPEMWRDELASWTAATRSVPELFTLLSHIDASSGAYYLVLHYVAAVFGASPLALRLPSLLAMCAAAACVSLVGKRLFSRRAGLAAGTVFALLPSVSRFGQEARSYAFVVMFVALSTLLLLRALERPVWLRWAGYALALAASGVFHLVALSCVAGHLAVVWLQWQRDRERRYWRFIAAVAVALLPVIPVALAALPQAKAQIGNVAEPALTTPLTDVTQLWLMLFCSGIGAGAVIVFAGLAWTTRRRAAAIGTAMALLPTVAVLVVSEFGTSYYMARYFMFTVPAWAVLAGAGIATVSRLRAMAIALVALAALIYPDQQAVRLPLAHDWWNYPLPPAPPAFQYSAAAKVIAGEWQPGDGVVYGERGSAPLTDLGIEYNLPDRVHLTDVLATGSPQAGGTWVPPECPSPTDCLRTGPKRVWVVNTDPTMFGGMEEGKIDGLLEYYGTVESTSVPGITVTLMVRD